MAKIGAMTQAGPFRTPAAGRFISLAEALSAARRLTLVRTPGDTKRVSVADPSGITQLGAYALDPLRHVLHCGAREVQLTPLASRLLQELAKRPGEMVERAALIDVLWRGDFLVGDPALSRLVSEIRRAVGDDARRPRLIQTVPRQGYRLVATVEQGAAAPIRVAPWGPQAWRLANQSIAIVLGGLTVLILAAMLARLFR